MVGFFQKLVNTFRNTAQAIGAAFGGGGGGGGQQQPPRPSPRPSPTTPTTAPSFQPTQQQPTTIEEAREISGLPQQKESPQPTTIEEAREIAQQQALQFQFPSQQTPTGQTPTQQESVAIALDFFKRQREGNLTPEDQPIIEALRAGSTDAALTAWMLGAGGPALEAIGSGIGLVFSRIFSKITLRASASTLQIVTSGASKKLQTKAIIKEIIQLSNGGKSLIGRRIPEATIKSIGKLAKLTPEGVQQLKRGLGVIRVNEVKQLIAGGANNLKTAALKQGFLAGLASKAKSPIAVLGLLGTVLYTSLFWAPNEKGDALTLLTIAQRDAVKAGDIDLANEIGDLIEETADIAASIPVLGFIQAELAKFEAARKASEASRALVEKLQRETAEAEALAAEGFGSAFEKQTVEAAERRREVELQQRAEDDDYWAGIIARNEKRKADERAADEEYWARIKQEEVQQDLDDADKQAIKDWNAGKSALNFKWLGR